MGILPECEQRVECGAVGRAGRWNYGPWVDVSISKLESRPVINGLARGSFVVFFWVREQSFGLECEVYEGSAESAGGYKGGVGGVGWCDGRGKAVGTFDNGGCARPSSVATGCVRIAQAVERQQ